MTIEHMRGGGLMVCGTTSDSGKTTVVTGLCRLLARRGLKVAPFKAQNMALNSAVTAAGHEIGRAQAAQAAAARAVPEVAMNPILLKPTSDRTSQVIVLGRPWATLDAAGYQAAKPRLWDMVVEQVEDLRSRFDVVICEGAGSPAEINLLDGDIVNLRVADAAGIRAVVVGDIERGGVFASLYGTVALLPDRWRGIVGGFIINKFRGDPQLLRGGPEELEKRLGVPTIGILPWVDGIGADAEDSLALARFGSPRSGGSALDVAVIGFPRISNFTDIDPLSAESDVVVRLVDSPSGLGHPDLLVLPGTKATVSDLAWLRACGLGAAVEELARPGSGTTVLGICGGHQMLGRQIDDGVESTTPVRAAGLGLLAVETVFEARKVTRVVEGTALGCPVNGYQIHHGRTTTADPWVTLSGVEEGSRSADGAVFGTSVHGLFESDAFRRRFLAGVAAEAGKAWDPVLVSFEAIRQERFERLADLLEEHLDLTSIDRLIVQGRPK